MLDTNRDRASWPDFLCTEKSEKYFFSLCHISKFLFLSGRSYCTLLVLALRIRPLRAEVNAQFILAVAVLVLVPVVCAWLRLLPVQEMVLRGADGEEATACSVLRRGGRYSLPDTILHPTRC